MDFAKKSTPNNYCCNLVFRYTLLMAYYNTALNESWNKIKAIHRRKGGKKIFHVVGT